MYMWPGYKKKTCLRRWVYTTHHQRNYYINKRLRICVRSTGLKIRNVLDHKNGWKYYKWQCWLSFKICIIAASLESWCSGVQITLGWALMCLKPRSQWYRIETWHISAYLTSLIEISTGCISSQTTQIQKCHNFWEFQKCPKFTRGLTNHE